MELSSLCHTFRREGVVALYNALNHSVRYFSEKQWEERVREWTSISSPGEATSASQEDFSLMVEEGFFLTEAEVSRQTRNMLEDYTVPCINVLYLLLVEGCNLACSYCMIENSFESRQSVNPMSWDLAKRGIDLYVHLLARAGNTVLANRGKLVNFYGGEPLLNRFVFEQSVCYLQELCEKGQLPDDLRMSVVTNGTIMDEALARFIAVNNVEIGVSIDGPSIIHDRNRTFRNRKGSHHLAVRTFKMLQEAGANVGVSCTVSPQTVDDLPDIFRWLLDEVGVTALGFNPIIESPGYQVNMVDYPERVAQSLIACYDIARQRGVFEDRMLRKVKAFVHGYFYDRDCSAIGRQVTIGPNGTIGICPTYYPSGKYFVPFTDDFDPFGHPIWNEWLGRMPLNILECAGCEALGICGGGCPFNADIRGGSIWKRDDFFCAHAKATLEWLVWDLYVQMNTPTLSEG